MAIMVQYAAGDFGSVRNDFLDDLIAAGCVIAFRRSSGWVEIGRDPIRGEGTGGAYAGPEQRAEAFRFNCLVCPDFVNSYCGAKVCSSRITMVAKNF